MTAWAHLPNAKLVDRVLADLRSRPLVWDAARDAARDAAWDADRGAAWDAAWDAARDAAWDVARDAARDASRDAAWAASRGTWNAWTATWAACMALIAWPEDSALMLDMPVDAMRLLAAAGHHPAVLMLPACIAMNGDSHDRMGPPA